MGRNFWSSLKEPFKEVSKVVDDVVEEVEDLSPTKSLIQSSSQKKNNFEFHLLPTKKGVKRAAKLNEIQLAVLGVAFGGGLSGPSVATALGEEAAGLEGLAGIENVGGELANLGEFESSIQKILQLGVAGTGLEEATEIIQGVKKAKKHADNGDYGDALKEVKDALDTANQLAKDNEVELDSLETATGILEKGQSVLGEDFEKLQSGIEVLHQQLGGIATLDHNDRIEENQGHINAVRSSNVILQDGLAELQKEGQEEVDALVRIATNLDRPTDINDMLTDISKFESAKAKSDYVIENYNTFVNLSPNEKSEILELLLDNGGLENISI